MIERTREYKKKRLRSHMINGNANNGFFLSSKDADRKAMSKKHKKKGKRRLLIWIMALVIIAAVISVWICYQRNYRFTSYEVVWETEINEGSLVEYETFGSNVLKVTKDGVSYIDNKGETMWTESYEMKNPVASVKGSYAVIADKQGNNMCICNEDGLQGKTMALLPISKVAISETGIVAAVLEDSMSSYIMFYRKDGTMLDISITTNMAGNGYPFDIDLSSDGTQLIISYVYIQNGELKSRVVFYDFSEIGKNIPGRLVGGFDEQFQGTLVGKVQFLESPYSCAFSGNSLNFFSSRNLASPAMIMQVSIKEKIQSVFCSDDYAGIIVKNDFEEYTNRMEIYKKNGELIMKKNFTYDYEKVDIDGDRIILYNQDSCRIYNMAGVMKLDISFDFAVSKIRHGRSFNTLLLIGTQIIKEIKLR